MADRQNDQQNTFLPLLINLDELQPNDVASNNHNSANTNNAPQAFSASPSFSSSLNPNFINPPFRNGWNYKMLEKCYLSYFGLLDPTPHPISNENGQVDTTPNICTKDVKKLPFQALVRQIPCSRDFDFDLEAVYVAMLHLFDFFLYTSNPYKCTENFNNNTNSINSIAPSATTSTTTIPSTSTQLPNSISSLPLAPPPYPEYTFDIATFDKLQQTNGHMFPDILQYGQICINPLFSLIDQANPYELDTNPADVLDYNPMEDINEDQQDATTFFPCSIFPFTDEFNNNNEAVFQYLTALSTPATFASHFRAMMLLDAFIIQMLDSSNSCESCNFMPIICPLLCHLLTRFQILCKFYDFEAAGSLDINILLDHALNKTHKYQLFSRSHFFFDRELVSEVVVSAKELSFFNVVLPHAMQQSPLTFVEENIPPSLTPIMSNTNTLQPTTLKLHQSSSVSSNPSTVKYMLFPLNDLAEPQFPSILAHFQHIFDHNSCLHPGNVPENTQHAPNTNQFESDFGSITPQKKLSSTQPSLFSPSKISLNDIPFSLFMYFGMLISSMSNLWHCITIHSSDFAKVLDLPLHFISTPNLPPTLYQIILYTTSKRITSCFDFNSPQVIQFLSDSDLISHIYSKVTTLIQFPISLENLPNRNVINSLASLLRFMDKISCCSISISPHLSHGQISFERWTGIREKKILFSKDFFLSFSFCGILLIRLLLLFEWIRVNSPTHLLVSYKNFQLTPNGVSFQNCIPTNTPSNFSSSKTALMASTLSTLDETSAYPLMEANHFYNPFTNHIFHPHSSKTLNRPFDFSCYTSFLSKILTIQRNCTDITLRTQILSLFTQDLFSLFFSIGIHYAQVLPVVDLFDKYLDGLFEITPSPKQDQPRNDRADYSYFYTDDIPHALTNLFSANLIQSNIYLIGEYLLSNQSFAECYKNKNELLVSIFRIFSKMIKQLNNDDFIHHITATTFLPFFNQSIAMYYYSNNIFKVKYFRAPFALTLPGMYRHLSSADQPYPQQFFLLHQFLNAPNQSQDFDELEKITKKNIFSSTSSFYSILVQIIYKFFSQLEFKPQTTIDLSVLSKTLYLPLGATHTMLYIVTQHNFSRTIYQILAIRSGSIPGNYYMPIN